MNPLVSVIVPLYNHERFVVKCLESVVNEDYDNLEIIILDDGSTDGSFAVAQSWVNTHRAGVKRLELHRQSHVGITKTLNRLLSMTRGEFITPLASDDYLVPGGIQARVDVLRKEKKWLAVFGDCLVVDEKENVICHSGVTGFHPGSARKTALLNRKLIAVELAMRWSVPGPVFLMKREALDVAGKYDESSWIEDRDYYLRLLVKGRLGFLDKVVACYRWHQGSTAFEKATERERIRSLIRAAHKSSKHARGILRLVLLLDYHRRRNAEWRDLEGWGRVIAGLDFLLAKVGWKLITVMHNTRYGIYSFLEKHGHQILVSDESRRK